MQDDCDVAVIGGAFSGAATALLLRRELPKLRVVVIERSRKFDRKVGEATTEVSGCFLTKRLGLTHHLCHHHVVKNGLRFWFSRESKDDFDRCGELGAFYQFGPVRSVTRCPRAGFIRFPFEGSVERAIACKFMGFYNQRLARIAQKRLLAGVYGLGNLDSRTLLKGFEPNWQVWKLILRGVRVWFRAELRGLFLATPVTAPGRSPISTA